VLCLTSENPDNQRTVSAEVVCSTINEVLYDIAAELRKTGCFLIGHIKALLDAGDFGQQFFSVTEFDKKPRCKGNISGNIDEAKLVLNVIVYGVGKDEIERAVDRIMKKNFPNYKCTD
jgi:hypothetical protein